ncbi:MAG: mechanosensitive ion channel [Rickettsiaceae bacterium]|nr:mechanosensitive ion channel [Rickettsiaceae bacterium]
MDELFAIENMYALYDGNQLLVMLCIMFVAFYPGLLVLKKLLLPGAIKLAGKRNSTYGEIAKKQNLSKHIIWVFSALYFMFCGQLLESSDLIGSTAIRVKDVILTIYIIASITSLLLTLMDIAIEVSRVKLVSKRLAIDLHIHIVKIIVVICAILTVFSLILGVSIGYLFTSLGAAAALLTFVFKDTILGLLASLQLTFQNVLQVGDWVTLPQYNADGEIKQITITIVSIRNFDGTYTSVPTSAFLSTGVKNWRQMFEGGGRRIKRSISIDMDTIKICDQKTLDTLKKMPYMTNVLRDNEEYFDAKMGLTNIAMFRHYVDQYLQMHPNIHGKEYFTFLVRQLEPTNTGVPIEIYVFSKDTEWSGYEKIQSEIFEHLFGIMPMFDLKPFQSVINS